MFFQTRHDQPTSFISATTTRHRWIPDTTQRAYRCLHGFRLCGYDRTPGAIWLLHFPRCVPMPTNQPTNHCRSEVAGIFYPFERVASMCSAGERSLFFICREIARIECCVGGWRKWEFRIVHYCGDTGPDRSKNFNQSSITRHKFSLQRICF